MLSCRDLTVAVPGRTLVRGLDFDLDPGETLAILGPNGVGKSISLHTLAGLRRPVSGRVLLGGEDIAELPRQHVATTLALLPQYTEDIFPTTVFDTAMIGRHPHIGRFHWESAEDRDIAAQALSQVDLAELAARDVRTLSGGERRRLAVAQVLAQAPRLYLLDEPTNHLDPQHQLDVLRLFAGKAESGDSVVVSLHDVNLAARRCHRARRLPPPCVTAHSCKRFIRTNRRNLPACPGGWRAESGSPPERSASPDPAAGRSGR